MRILIAEDDRDLAKMLVTILKMNKYVPESVDNGEDALLYATQNAYDLIILDVMMPKMTGFEVLEALRRKRIFSPVLMLTAKASLDDKVHGLDLGADDYLPKPFETKELLARIRALTRRKYAEMKTYSFGDLTLDVKTQELACGEKTENLSGKEYSIMRILIEGNGKTGPTDEIIDSAWDYDNPADTSNLMIFITKLRKKLAVLDSSVYIKSVKGVGYQLISEDK